MDQAKTLEKIRPLFENNAEVAAVYIFGSQASPKARFDSDIDLAILFEQRLIGYEAYQRRERYFVQLARTLNTDVDVLDMEQVNLILLFEILQRGAVLFENNREKHRGFLARKNIECLDFQFTVKRCAEGLQRKSLERVRGQDRRTLQENIAPPL